MPEYKIEFQNKSKKILAQTENLVEIKKIVKERDPSKLSPVKFNRSKKNIKRKFFRKRVKKVK